MAILYPDRLQGEAIPLGARILAVADAYDAMTSARPYRQARSPEEAREVLRRGAGRQWDARAVATLLDYLAEQDGVAAASDLAPERPPIRGVSATDPASWA